MFRIEKNFRQNARELFECQEIYFVDLFQTFKDQFFTLAYSGEFSEYVTIVLLLTAGFFVLFNAKAIYNCLWEANKPSPTMTGRKKCGSQLDPPMMVRLGLATESPCRYEEKGVNEPTTLVPCVRLHQRVFKYCKIAQLSNFACTVHLAAKG